MRDFDIVHIHSMWLYPNIAAYHACRRYNIPYMVRPAGSLEPWALGFKRFKKSIYYCLLEREMLNRAAAIHAVSEQEAKNIAKVGVKAPIVMIPNGIDMAEFEMIPSRMDARRELGLPLSAPLILFLGRIHHVKGMDILGQAFSRILGAMPQARLAIVGPDQHEYAKKVKAQYHELGLSDSVHFLGERSGADKLAAYAAADVFVLPSRSENFGLVIAESLAAGTPVVISNNTPWRDVEEAGAGYWIELKPDLFAEYVLRILKAPGLAGEMGRKGRQLIQDRYSWSGIAVRMLECYEQIVSRRFVMGKTGQTF